jgi:hypothetical protein
MPRRGYDPARAERKAERERAMLTSIEENFIAYNDHHIPVFRVKDLVWLCKNEVKYPDDLRKSLEKLLDAGLLSQSADGNFIVKIQGVVVLTMNPSLNSEPCYFTNQGDARAFAGRITTRFGNVVVNSEGEYPLSNPMTAEEWREIRAKHGTEQFDLIVQRLQSMGILTCQRKDKFSIVKKTVSKAGKAEYEYLNFRSGKGYGLLYFQESRDAYHFLEAFPNIPAKSEISVVQEQVEA